MPSATIGSSNAKGCFNLLAIDVYFRYMPFAASRQPLFEAQAQFTRAPNDPIEALLALEQQETGILPSTLKRGDWDRPQPAGQGAQWDLRHDEEGELAVDVYETDAELIVMAAIAGVRANDLQITLQQDMLTIRGKRVAPHPLEAAVPLVEECYWGAFSRTLILPTAVDPSAVEAKLSSGVLTVRLRKITTNESIPIVECIDEEEPL